MKKLAGLRPEKVFAYFEEISAIPRGSGDMERISQYCLDFAEKHGLKAIRDAANNVIIYKNASPGYEQAAPVILQGHLDMVCQKDENSRIDFEKDGLDIYIDGDFIKAQGTTLGADNGIAVAMVLAILEDDSIEHPPLEAVFTTDEEIGMIGAGKLDMTKLSGRKMVNLDSEGEGIVTVSCAGGMDVTITAFHAREKKSGTPIKLVIKGLQGGHSGVEINKGRVNADMLLGRILHHAKGLPGFRLIHLCGGDKGNAIPLYAEAEFLAEEPEETIRMMKTHIALIKEELAAREPGFCAELTALDRAVCDVMTEEMQNKLLFLLMCAPSGVQEMSAEIENLVETSVNLGILKTDGDSVTLLFSVRSNKQSALIFYGEKIKAFAAAMDFKAETSGIYPPWEFKSDSALQSVYRREFKKILGYEPAVEAIHAGLECGIFASSLPGLDCISIGPDMYDLHITAERVSISSVKNIFDVVCSVLKACK